MADAIPVLKLKKGREHSLLLRHPWVFSGVLESRRELSPGATVHLVRHNGEYLATGAWSPDSAIAVRIWSFDQKEEIDAAFFLRKVQQALALRKRVFGTLPDAYRLIDAESDGLPGVVADCYGPYAVVQFSSTGAEHIKQEIAAALLSVACGVYERSDLDVRKREGLPPVTGQLAGIPVPECVEFTENGVKYGANLHHGHKTGFYLDQRTSRAVLGSAAKGLEVLNCFCYTGGFGLAALHGGAVKSINVDSSAPALAAARENARRNGFGEEAFETVEADVFTYLRRCRDSRKEFDCIVLDPPKFADSTAMLPKASRGYKDINLLAMKLLKKGGSLFTFSCSGAMTDELFFRILTSAAADAGREFRVTGFLSQGPDHPVSAAFPEGRYLKGLCGTVY